LKSYKKLVTRVFIFVFLNKILVRKMKWKLLVAVAVVLAVLGFLFFTEEGRKYAISLGSLTRSFTSTVGNFVGSFVKISSGNGFGLELNLNKEAIYGQSFSFSNSGFEASGRILSLKIDGKTWEIGEKVKVELVGNGKISIGNDGRLALNVDTNLLKLDSWKTSNVKVEMEMIPDNLLMNNAKADLINTTSASGNVNKKLDEIEVKVDLNKANLEVENFFGTIELKDKLKLSGTATNIEINGKKI